jgi:hypothetical protein
LASTSDSRERDRPSGRRSPPRPLALARGGDVVGVRQARLEIAEDLAEESRREESRPEGAGCILADGRQQPESHSDLRGHVIKLPADLLTHSVCSVRRGETSGLRAYAAAPRAWAPMRDGCGLSGRPSGPLPLPGPALHALGRHQRSGGGFPLRRQARRARKPASGRIRSRGRLSPGAAASKISSTCSAQSAGHAATVRRSASLSVCGERIHRSFQPGAAIWTLVGERRPDGCSVGRPLIGRPVVTTGIHRMGGG